MLVIGDDDPTSKVPADQPTTNAPTTVAQVTEESLQLSDRRVREAAARRIGFVGLPPVEARPSTPERGILALAIRWCTTSPGFDGLSVFADGRLIWAVSGRMVEQHLTPEGVELMRSELLDSGLFDPRQRRRMQDRKYYGHSRSATNMGRSSGLLLTIPALRFSPIRGPGCPRARGQTARSRPSYHPSTRSSSRSGRRESSRTRAILWPRYRQPFRSSSTPTTGSARGPARHVLHRLDDR